MWGWFIVKFNQWVLIFGRWRDKKENNRIGEWLNYQWAGFNVEALANCVVGQMRSLESRCKTFQLSLKWTKWTEPDQSEQNGPKWDQKDQMNQNGLNGPKWTIVDRTRPKWSIMDQWTIWTKMWLNGIVNKSIKTIKTTLQLLDTT